MAVLVAIERVYPSVLLTGGSFVVELKDTFKRVARTKDGSICVTDIRLTFDSFQNSPFSKIQEGEFKIIRDIAAEDTGCVIVGRAADYILRNEDHVSIFLFAPLEDRIQRKLKLAKMNETDEPTDEASMEKLVKQTDKQRRRYYEFYTDNKWGGREPYDLLINTSRSGVNGAVEIIEAYIMNSHGKDILSDM